VKACKAEALKIVLILVAGGELKKHQYLVRYNPDFLSYRLSDGLIETINGSSG